MENPSLSVKNQIDLQSVNAEDIIPFDQRRITTMVCIVRISGEILPAQAFTLLPITVPVETSNALGLGRIEKRLPHNGIPGSIISMRFENEIRGLIFRVKKSTHFRNSITIDMS